MSSLQIPSIKSSFRRNSVCHNSYCCIDSNRNSIFFAAKKVNVLTKNNVLALGYRGQAGSVAQQNLDNLPLTVELEPLSDESQFDRVIAEAQQLDESVVILWMATWCRKCIYLKPKLEKLAADYYPRIRFYCVDVNNVSHKLVVRAGVAKMPTIQLWRDNQKQAEVIGGHKAHLVVNEVREMIGNENSMSF